MNSPNEKTSQVDIIYPGSPSVWGFFDYTFTFMVVKMSFLLNI